MDEGVIRTISAGYSATPNKEKSTDTVQENSGRYEAKILEDQEKITGGTYTADDTDPVFDRGRKVYVYENGVEQKVVLNRHL